MKSYYVYFMSSTKNTTLYIGVTNNLERRVLEHKNHAIKGFTDKYNCTKLVYFEEALIIEAAIAREKQLKKWSRAKKEELINSSNAEWEDLSKNWV